MKTAKRIALLMLALAMLLALTACGGKSADVRGSVSTAESNEQRENIDGKNAAEEDGTAFGLGTMNGGVYANEFLGLGCTLDENWTYFSEEELLELNGLTAEMVQDEDIAEMLENSNTIYDMYAMAEDGLVTINITLENVGVLYGMALSEERYLEIASDLLESTLASSGLEDVELTAGTATFAGEEHGCIWLSASLAISEEESVPVYEMLVCIKKGNYMANVTLCSYQEDITDTLAALFYAL